MSLAITVITPEGIVQATDSRVSIPLNVGEGVVSYSYFDNATKILTFDAPHDNVSVSTFGAGTIGSRTAHSFIHEFQDKLPSNRLTVRNFAKKLQDFYKEEWDSIEDNPQTTSMYFLIAGINNNQQFGELYVVSVPGEDHPLKVISNGEFSVYYGGEKSTVDRLIQGRDTKIDSLISADQLPNDTQVIINNILLEVASQHMLPLGAYALQDAIDLARFLISTTSNMQKLSLNVKTVGGAIDVCCITKNEGCKMISKKTIG